MASSQHQADLTELIRRAESGDEGAFDALFEAMYADLHRIARARLRRTRPVTALNTTALVHESYIRFTEAGRLSVGDRAHFLRYAGRVMRSVIVDSVRRRQAQRRGGDAPHVTLNTRNLHDHDAAVGELEILRVHEALEAIAEHDMRMVQVVEMRYFGGLTEAEIAEALEVTERTVRRDWTKARVLLAQALK